MIKVFPSEVLRINKLTLCLFTLLLSACVTNPNYSVPKPQQDKKWHAPSQLKSQLEPQPEAELELKFEQQLQPLAASDWWQQFNDPLLNELIDEAARNNRDLAIALANIEAARAARDLAESGYFPKLEAGANASRNRYSSQTSFGLNTGTRDNFNASLQASWEPDLFGRTGFAVTAAEAELGASQAAQQGLLLTVVAEVAINYFEIRGLQQQLAMTTQDISLLRRVEDIARIQSESGITTRLDLARAQGERQSFQAKIPNLKADIATRIYRIAVLTGKPPESHHQRFNNSPNQYKPADVVPVGLRSDILKRRPDMLQAEFKLTAATANIELARANLFPSFSLTGAIGSSARVFSDLFSPATLTSSLGAALGWPIFEGGAYQTKVAMAQAEVNAALANYEQAVLLALEDAESALLRYGSEWLTLKQLRTAENTRREAAAIARLRYDAGEEGLLSVLETERSLIVTRNEIISSETRMLTRLALLYKSLGGGWQGVD